jgi:hypothetical protein
VAPPPDDAGTTGTSQRRQHRPPASAAVLAAAVVATLTPTVLVTLVVVASAVWSAAGGAGPGPLEALSEAGAWIGFVGAITMTGVYAVGVPVALVIERLASGRAALRWVAYGLVGAGAGATAGAWIATSRVALPSGGSGAGPPRSDAGSVGRERSRWSGSPRRAGR